MYNILKAWFCNIHLQTKLPVIQLFLFLQVLLYTIEAAPWRITEKRSSLGTAAVAGVLSAYRESKDQRVVSVDDQVSFINTDRFIKNFCMK